MGRTEGADNPKPAGIDRAAPRVFKPCPACGRAVELWDETRVATDPETYACPSCGARFYLLNAMP